MAITLCTVSNVNITLLGDGTTTAFTVDLSKAPFNLNLHPSTGAATLNTAVNVGFTTVFSTPTAVLITFTTAPSATTPTTITIQVIYPSF